MPVQPGPDSRVRTLMRRLRNVQVVRIDIPYCHFTVRMRYWDDTMAGDHRASFRMHPSF